MKNVQSLIKDRSLELCASCGKPVNKDKVCITQGCKYNTTD